MNWLIAIAVNLVLPGPVCRLNVHPAQLVGIRIGTNGRLRIS